jgi:hypothetical protein
MALFIEKDVDLLSAFHRNCMTEPWAIQPGFHIESCTFVSAEGCRAYRTYREPDPATNPPPYLHGNFLPLTDCTLHVVGVRATMSLEGLTRGFDLDAKDAVATMISINAGVPREAVVLINTRTVGGYEGYVVGDCRRKGCRRRRGGGGGGQQATAELDPLAHTRTRLRRSQVADGTAAGSAIAVEFDVLINTNDGVASQVGISFEHMENGTDPNLLRRLALDLSLDSELVLSVSDVASEDLEADAMVSRASGPCAPGEFSFDGSCAPCDRGQFSDGSDELCFKCPVDTFGNATGASTCTPCGPCSSQPTTGSTRCVVDAQCALISTLAPTPASTPAPTPASTPAPTPPPHAAKNSSVVTGAPFIAGICIGLVLVFILIGFCCKRKCQKHGPSGVSLGPLGRKVTKGRTSEGLFSI